jgi:hypothetical protein
MANLAIVVGVNRYANQRAFLKGGRRDSRKIRDRLLSPAGQNPPLTNDAVRSPVGAARLGSVIFSVLGLALLLWAGCASAANITPSVPAAATTNPGLAIAGVSGPEGLVVSTTATDFARPIQIINTSDETVRVVVELPNLIGPDSKPVQNSWTLAGKPASQATAEIKPLDSFGLELNGDLRAVGDYTSTISLIYGSKRYAVPVKITRNQSVPTVDVIGLDPVAFEGFTGPRSLRFSLKENAGMLVTLRAPTLLSLTRKSGDQSLQADYDSVEFSTIDGTGNLKKITDSLPIHPNASVQLEMRLVGLRGPGEYIGSLSFSSAAGSLPAKSFTMYLKRSIFTAAIFIALGVLISHLLRTWTKTGRPRLILMRRAVLLNEDLEKLSASLTDQPDQELINSFRQRLDRVRDDIGNGVATDVEPRLSDINAKLNLVTQWSNLRKRIATVQLPNTVDAARQDLDDVEGFLKADKIDSPADITTNSGKLTDAFKKIDDAVRGSMQAAINLTKTQAQTAKNGLAQARQNEFQNEVIAPLTDAEIEIAKTPPDADGARRLLNDARLAYARILSDDLDEKIRAIARPNAIPQDQWDKLIEAFRTSATKARTSIDGDAAVAAYEDTYRTYLQLLVRVATEVATELKARANADQSTQLDAALKNLEDAQGRINNSELDLAKQSYDSAQNAIDAAAKALTPAAIKMSFAPGGNRLQATMLSSASTLFCIRAIPGFERLAERRRSGWSSVKDIDRAITMRDRWVTVIVGLAAVVLGVHSIWMDNLSWGTSKDMFTAVLWGLGLHQVAGNVLFAKLDYDQLQNQLTGAKPTGGTNAAP